MVHNDIHAFFMLYQHRDPASSKQRITEYSKQDPASTAITLSVGGLQAGYTFPAAVATSVQDYFSFFSS